MFKDKVYEELDEISKLVEPYQSSLNEELSQFPDEIEITKEKLMEYYSKDWGWSSLRISSVVQKEAEHIGLKNLASEWRLEEFFKFEVRDIEEDEQVTINFKTGVLSHPIFLVKTKLGYEDQELQKMAKDNILRAFAGFGTAKDVNKSRMNEIAELFNANDVKSDRSYKGKVKKMKNHIAALIDDNKLDIRDLELCKKFGYWIYLYVAQGNLPALNNVTRIKIMMHENRPIYSIEERSVK